MWPEDSAATEGTVALRKVIKSIEELQEAAEGLKTEAEEGAGVQLRQQRLVWTNNEPEPDCCWDGSPFYISCGDEGLMKSLRNPHLKFLYLLRFEVLLLVLVHWSPAGIGFCSHWQRNQKLAWREPQKIYGSVSRGRRSTPRHQYGRPTGSCQWPDSHSTIASIQGRAQEVWGAGLKDGQGQLLFSLNNIEINENLNIYTNIRKLLSCIFILALWRRRINVNQV